MCHSFQHFLKIQKLTIFNILLSKNFGSDYLKYNKNKQCDKNWAGKSLDLPKMAIKIKDCPRKLVKLP